MTPPLLEFLSPVPSSPLHPSTTQSHWRWQPFVSGSGPGFWREERLSSFYNLCHNTASLGPIVPSGINQSTVSFQLAASTLAPGTHLLPVPLRFPLPAGQLSPCLGENRAVISPENYRSSDQMLLQRSAGICHSEFKRTRPLSAPKPAER